MDLIEKLTKRKIQPGELVTALPVSAVSDAFMKLLHNDEAHGQTIIISVSIFIQKNLYYITK